ncbi:undecaprenyl-diphosphatase [Metabacillus bambusae]|uniref:Undecaprenyl-diphosphatase n=1 Tax=Metabacillus bambusae TaxID=2795218 RepID=A0ABS3N7C0_9BACI|nr:undecaprenyl-diphosphatase [Metabacillus bambusae]MBO1514187.1 undecaprenyl-diphosphatase [Metabacillus bambusae]
MDYKMFKAINRPGQYSLMDMLMILISKKARYVFIFVLGIIWFRSDSDKKVVLNAVKSTVFTLLIDTLIKLFYFKPRPFMKRRVGILIPSKMDSSFPSKHTLLAFAVSTSFILRVRVLGLFMMGLSVLTGLSRIWVGHHYPSDIIGSAFIGSITSVVIDKTSRYFNSFVRL